MKRFTAEDSETRSPDVVAENIEQLMALFPEAFTEGKVDFEVLKQLLGGAVEEREEKYGLNWYGKRRARQLALTPSTGTLRPCPEDSVDWDTSRNYTGAALLGGSSTSTASGGTVASVGSGSATTASTHDHGPNDAGRADLGPRRLGEDLPPDRKQCRRRSGQRRRSHQRQAYGASRARVGLFQSARGLLA